MLLLRSFMFFREVGDAVDEAARAPLPRKGMIPRAENVKMIPYSVDERKRAGGAEVHFGNAGCGMERVARRGTSRRLRGPK